MTPASCFILKNLFNQLLDVGNQSPLDETFEDHTF